MNKDERQVACAKVIILEALAEHGFKPSDLGRQIKEAMQEIGPVGMQKVSSVGGEVVEAGGKGLLWLAKLAPVLALLAGGTGGYLAEQMFGPTEADVVRERMKQQIGAYRRATFRRKAETQAREAEKSDERRSQGRPRLQISSAL